MAPCSIEGLGFLRDLIALPLPAMGSKFQTQFPNHRYRCHPCCTGILGAYQVGAVHITCLEPSHPECSLAATSKQVKAITQIAPGHPGCASETLQACFTCLPPAPFLFFLCDFSQEASILSSLWPSGWSQQLHIKQPRKGSWPFTLTWMLPSLVCFKVLGKEILAFLRFFLWMIWENISFLQCPT